MGDSVRTRIRDAAFWITLENPDGYPRLTQTVLHSLHRALFRGDDFELVSCFDCTIDRLLTSDTLWMAAQKTQVNNAESSTAALQYPKYRRRRGSRNARQPTYTQGGLKEIRT